MGDMSTAEARRRASAISARYAWRRTDLTALYELSMRGPQSHEQDKDGKWYRLSHPRLYWPGAPIPKRETHSAARARRRGQ